MAIVKNAKKDIGSSVLKTYKNKMRALARHVKKFPDDLQGAQQFDSLKSLGSLRTPRKKPNTPKWSSSEIRFAILKAKADIGQTPEDIRNAEMLKQKKESLVTEGVSGASQHKDKGRSKAKPKMNTKQVQKPNKTK